MEWIETSDKAFDLIRNRVPVRTLKFNFGIGVLLGGGGSMIDTKREGGRRGERRR